MHRRHYVCNRTCIGHWWRLSCSSLCLTHTFCAFWIRQPGDFNPNTTLSLGWGELSWSIKPKGSSSSLIDTSFQEEGGYCPKLSDPLSSPHQRNTLGITHLRHSQHISFAPATIRHAVFCDHPTWCHWRIYAIQEWQNLGTLISRILLRKYIHQTKLGATG